MIYAVSDIGKPKVDAAAAALRALNSNTQVESHALALDASNVDQTVDGYDLVLDGTDNFETRFAVNAACVRAGKSLISGALGRWTGQVGVFEGRPCYQCLVPEIPPDAETCQAVGLVGALAGVIGSLMALEAVKHITGAGQTLAGRLLIYDALAADARTVTLTTDPNCPICAKAWA